MPKGQAIAKASLVYAQFADGTSLGDAAAAKDVLNERVLCLKALRGLGSAKSNDDFHLKLTSVHTEGTGTVIQKIREVEKDNGTNAAREQVHKFLMTAEEFISKRAVASAK